MAGAVEVKEGALKQKKCLSAHLIERWKWCFTYKECNGKLLQMRTAVENVNQCCTENSALQDVPIKA